MIGYYFIQNKYLYIGNMDNDKDKDKNGNAKYTKEMTSPPVSQVSNIRMKESLDTKEDENENLIHNNKNKEGNIAMAYKKLLNYIF